VVRDPGAGQMWLYAYECQWFGCNQGEFFMKKDLPAEKVYCPECGQNLNINKPGRLLVHVEEAE
jgi:hypothetical protein